MPRQISRRDALKLALAGGVATVLQACSRPSHADKSETVHRFEAALPIPPVLEPTRSDEHGDYYEIEARESDMAILPERQTTIRGYNGIFPGPTIKATRGRVTHVRFTSKLQTPVVTHLHGGHTPSDSDGWPTDVILPLEPAGTPIITASQTNAIRIATTTAFRMISTLAAGPARIATATACPTSVIMIAI